MKRLTAPIIYLLLLMVTTATYAEYYESSMYHDGFKRYYLAYVPSSYNPSVPVPLIIALHGATDNMWAMALISKLALHGDKYGIITVFPQGTALNNDASNGYGWNDGYAEGCGEKMVEKTIDDVGFIEALINLLKEIYTIDPTRMAIVGMSNGGFMANRFVSEHSEMVSSLVTTYASIGGFDTDIRPAYVIPPPKNKLSALIVNDRSDPLISYNGGLYGACDLNLYSVSDSLQFWVNANGLQDSSPVYRKLPGKVIRIAYRDITNHIEVDLISSQTGYHTWLGCDPATNNKLYGYWVPEHPVKLSGLICQFVTKHPREVHIR